MTFIIEIFFLGFFPFRCKFFLVFFSFAASPVLKKRRGGEEEGSTNSKH